LLLHDIHPTTVAALPDLLKALKDKRFHIVQVVPATLPDQVVVAGNAKTRMLASAMPEQFVIDDDPAQPAWPQSAAGLSPDDAVLPAPDASAFDPDAGLAADATAVKWPDQPAAKTAAPKPQLAALNTGKIALPVGRQQLEVTGSIDRSRARPEPSRAAEPSAYRHARVRPAAANSHADLFSGIRALATLWPPTH
jgi:hypothetical protein